MYNSQTEIGFSFQEIDLTKPWVTEEIKSEDAKKQELLEVWRKTKDDGDWSNYKSQKQVVKTLYDKAKDEYLATHQEEVSSIIKISRRSKMKQAGFCY